MGVFVDFEGGDGSGKGTQSKLLVNYFEAQGIPTKFLSFPRYETPTGQKVADYLNGNPADAVDARVAGKLYSDDRLAAKEEMLKWLASGGSIVTDRYVYSNHGHQGGKLPTREERIAYFKDSEELEFRTNGLPVPDAVMLLSLPPYLAQQYVDQKMARKYTDKKRDRHEADPHHLQNANEAFALFAELNPELVHPVLPYNEQKLEMHTRESIHYEIVTALRPLLLSQGLLDHRSQ